MQNYTKEELEAKLKVYLKERYPEIRKTSVNIDDICLEIEYYLEKSGVKLDEHWFDYMKKHEDYNDVSEAILNKVARHCLLGSEDFKKRVDSGQIEVIRF